MNWFYSFVQKKKKWSIKEKCRKFEDIFEELVWRNDTKNNIKYNTTDTAVSCLKWVEQDDVNNVDTIKK